MRKNMRSLKTAQIFRDGQWTGLIGIYETYALYCARVHTMPLPDRLTSIRGIHEALVRVTTAPTHSETTKAKEKALAEKVKASFKGFWRVIATRPPEVWKDDEKLGFLVDLAGRERIRRERGWELPVIDIEVEGVN